MSHSIRATACSFGRHGSTWNVAGSGIATMSASSTRAKPSIDAPSNVTPSSRACSSSSMVMATDLSMPRMSVNHRRMNFTSWS